MDFTLVLVFVIGFIASLYGVIVGGSGLLVIPSLMLMGFSPINAIANVRVGAGGTSIFGWIKFHQKGLIDYKVGIIVGVASFFGSIIGAYIVLDLPDWFLKPALGVTILSMLTFLFFKPKLGLERVAKELNGKRFFIGAIAGFFLGVYGSVFAAGTGAMLTFFLIVYFGETFIESAATRKIAGILTSIGGGLIFFLNGAVDLFVAGTLFAGMSMGAYIGAHYSDRLGNAWIRRMFFVVVIAVTLKLFF